MPRQTPLHQQHLDAGARMIDFAGWDMPLHYGSQMAEHQQVRTAAGVFDVSHMGVIDVQGEDVRDFLRYLLSNDITRIDEPGRAQYTLLLNPEGGVMDDLIVYHLGTCYRLVVNCATRESDLEWIRQQAREFDVQVTPRPELGILAVHGPTSIEAVCEHLPAEQARVVRTLGNFRCVELEDGMVARTGYTGEKGLELILPADALPALWAELLADGVLPVGLGARDTLRLEAGMNLYGHDMDETTSPLAANLEQVVAWEPEERNFIGRDAVTFHRRQQLAGELPALKGLVLEGRGVPREGQRVMTDCGEGILTSGCFSPTLKLGIALARVPVGSRKGEVEIRDKRVPARLVKPGFVRFGRRVVE